MFGYRPGPDIDADGWSVFGSLPGDATAIYVSKSTGNNANPGTFASPKETANAGMTAFNALTKGRGHRLLFKAGDEWPNTEYPGLTALAQYGKNHRELALVSSYDVNGDVPARVGARPLFNLPPTLGSAGIRASGGLITSGFNNCAIVGLEFYSPQRDPNNGAFVDDTSDGNIGIQTFNPFQFNLIEDCKIGYCQGGIYFQAIGGFLSIRRNIINNNWTGASSNQGVFALRFGFMLFQENFLYTNGWDPVAAGAERDQFNHNFYCDSDDITAGIPTSAGVHLDNGIFAGRLEAIGNVVSRPSANGIQCRPGGRMVDNLYLHCPIVGFIDGKGRSAFEYNVALHGVDGGFAGANASGFNFNNGFSLTPPAGGVASQYLDRGARDSLMSNNIIAHDECTVAPAYSYAAIARNATFVDNITYSHAASPHLWSNVGDGETGFDETTEIDEGGYPDAARTLYTYDTSIGGPGTEAHFIAGGLGRAARTWPTAYTANAVNNYIRAGFGRAAVTPVPRFHGTRSDGG